MWDELGGHKEGLSSLCPLDWLTSSQTQPDLAYDAADVDDGARTAAGHQGLGCSLSD